VRRSETTLERKKINQPVETLRWKSSSETGKGRVGEGRRQLFGVKGENGEISSGRGKKIDKERSGSDITGSLPIKGHELRREIKKSRAKTTRYAEGGVLYGR